MTKKERRSRDNKEIGEKGRERERERQREREIERESERKVNL